MLPYSIETGLAIQEGRLPPRKPPTRWERIRDNNEFQLLIYPVVPLIVTIAGHWVAGLLVAIFAREVVREWNRR